MLKKTLEKRRAKNMILRITARLQGIARWGDSEWTGRSVIEKIQRFAGSSIGVGRAIDGPTGRAVHTATHRRAAL